MATVQTVIDSSVTRQKDQRKTQWADAECLIYLQKAVDHVNNILCDQDSDFVRETNTLAITDGTQEYTLSTIDTYFLAPCQNGVWITGSDPMLGPVSPSEKAVRGVSEDEPTQFYIDDEKIGFIPIPETSYTVNVRHYLKSTTLTVSSSMPYGDMFDTPIAKFMDAVCAARNQMTPDLWLSLYNSLGEEVMKVLSKRVQ